MSLDAARNDAHKLKYATDSFAEAIDTWVRFWRKKNPPSPEEVGAFYAEWTKGGK
jgi:hypothetical protein